MYKWTLMKNNETKIYTMHKVKETPQNQNKKEKKT